MTILGKTQFGLLLGLCFCLGCIKSQPEQLKKDGGSRTKASKRTFGQLALGAFNLGKLCAEGTISSEKILEFSDGKMHFFELANPRNLCGKDSSGNAAVRQMEPFWLSTAGIGTSGNELAIGTRVFVFAFSGTGSTRIGTETISYHQSTTLPFDEDTEGNTSVRLNSVSEIQIVEEAEIRFANIEKTVANAINGKMRIFEDYCFGSTCDVKCVSHAYRNLATQGEECEGLMDCYYGSECTRIKVLEKPDPCTECGDEPAREGFIERIIDGVRHCWDPDTLAEIDCP